jgi:hypothetical protein
VSGALRHTHLPHLTKEHGSQLCTELPELDFLFRFASRQNDKRMWIPPEADKPPQSPFSGGGVPRRGTPTICRHSREGGNLYKYIHPWIPYRVRDDEILSCLNSEDPMTIGAGGITNRETSPLMQGRYEGVLSVLR